MGHGLQQNPDQTTLNLSPTIEDENDSLKYTDLISAFKDPSCFIIDADYAGNMYPIFADETIGNKDRIGFFACSEDEILPRKVRLPADLFTSCMLTPAYVAILLESRQFYAFKKEGIHELELEDFSENGNLKNLIMPFTQIINKMMNCLVRAMSLEVLKPTDHYNIFFKDPKVSHLFVNFCFAQHIGNEIGFHPLSYPKIPDFTEHPLWEYLCMYLDHVLYYLLAPFDNTKQNQIVNYDKNVFLSDVLSSITNALNDRFNKDIPRQFALFPLIFDDDNLVEKGIETLILYFDKRQNLSIKNSICLGMIECLTTIQTKNHLSSIKGIAYCLCKLLAFAYTNKNGYELFLSYPNDILTNLIRDNSNDVNITLAIVLLTIMCSLDGSYVENFPNKEYFVNLSNGRNKMHIFWSLLFISLFVDAFEELPQGDFNLFFNKVCNSIIIDDPDIKSASINVLSSLIVHDIGFISIDLVRNTIVENYLSPSQIVRMQTFLLLQNFLISDMANDEVYFKDVFECLVAMKDDANPDIANAAKYIFQKFHNKDKNDVLIIPYHSSALIDGSISAFLKIKFDNLHICTDPPFNPHIMPLTKKVLPSMGAFPQSNYIFNEIDKVEHDKKVTTNIAFIDENFYAFGDVDGSICVRNFTEHITIKHNKQKFFRSDNNSPLSFVTPFLNDSLITGTKNGFISIISGIHGEMYLNDSFKVPAACHLELNSTEFDDIKNCFMIGTEEGTVEIWDASRCQNTNPIKLLDEGISKIHLSPEDNSLIGVIGRKSGCLKWFDSRSGFDNPVIYYGDGFVEFETVKFERGGFLALGSDGKMSQFRLNSMNKRSFTSLDNYEIFDVSLHKPCFIACGKSLDVVDLISGTPFHVLPRLYSFKPGAISSIDFNSHQHTFCFVANGNTIHATNVAN
ncbi:hypothetical protein TVAG_058190 [Trichomonas vaginalis G3]|uniref:Raptor N-terminal CASPase-like domain-containing protein n=1 Tax=Trichomonas vaginalis (strain ATCC PRA-98 / G3) TaxID=412133 RepID=A2EQ79_TRIV3|nr:TOR signaling [Trichomonas vaginalis G3]EAY05162.1 hypothetical protein TVAG_058190 [Trichomonas vaginalis G3]KAI5522931.1 TOR signaling [Trichomonas vaginalis G3]|eukprot:XP_001317385.1 hypothetical protein [Trichomonas vaginalis G3]